MFIDNSYIGCDALAGSRKSIRAEFLVVDVNVIDRFPGCPLVKTTASSITSSVKIWTLVVICLAFAIAIILAVRAELSLFTILQIKREETRILTADRFQIWS